jgi:hypothetical protein
VSYSIKSEQRRVGELAAMQPCHDEVKRDDRRYPKRRAERGQS